MIRKKGKFVKISFLFAICSIIFAPSTNTGASPNNTYTASTSKFSNPINTAGADPYVMLHSDGYYYFTRTLGNRIDIWKSRTLTGIDLGERKTVWEKPENLKDIWAPEIHHYNGKWYIHGTWGQVPCPKWYTLENEAQK